MDRRSLARDLSRLADASVEEVLAEYRSFEPPPIIGITGSPGAGKSTLIADLASYRSKQESTQMAVLAIDPTSPFSGGAILGDRIRMAGLADHPNIYIRSIATRRSHNGLADNLPLLVARLAQEAFSEIIIETTGVGQVEFALRDFADTMILVLTPASGDSIQAMKSGIMEVPDLFVINKSDLPGASQLENEVKSVLRLRNRSDALWQPRVVQTSTHSGSGSEMLSALINLHRATLLSEDQVVRSRRLKVAMVRNLVMRCCEQIFSSEEDLRPYDTAEQMFDAALSSLASRSCQHRN